LPEEPEESEDFEEPFLPEAPDQDDQDDEDGEEAAIDALGEAEEVLSAYARKPVSRRSQMQRFSTGTTGVSRGARGLSRAVSRVNVRSRLGEMGAKKRSLLSRAAGYVKTGADVYTGKKSAYDVLKESTGKKTALVPGAIAGIEGVDRGGFPMSYVYIGGTALLILFFVMKKRKKG
jgi:hypothetical protein